jgi:hypothetical protein
VQCRQSSASKQWMASAAVTPLIGRVAHPKEGVRVRGAGKAGSFSPVEPRRCCQVLQPGPGLHGRQLTGHTPHVACVRPQHRGGLCCCCCCIRAPGGGGSCQAWGQAATLKQLPTSPAPQVVGNPPGGHLDLTAGGCCRWVACLHATLPAGSSLASSLAATPSTGAKPGRHCTHARAGGVPLRSSRQRAAPLAAPQPRPAADQPRLLTTHVSPLSTFPVAVQAGLACSSWRVPIWMPLSGDPSYCTPVRASELAAGPTATAVPCASCAASRQSHSNAARWRACSARRREAVSDMALKQAGSHSCAR